MGIYCDLTDWLGHPDAEGPSGKPCGDTCPTDTTERCEREPGHGGWHEGKRLRWRRSTACS